MIPDPWLVANLHDVPVRYRDIAFVKFIAMAAAPAQREDLAASLGLREWWPGRVLERIGA